MLSIAIVDSYRNNILSETYLSKYPYSYEFKFIHSRVQQKVTQIQIRRNAVQNSYGKVDFGIFGSRQLEASGNDTEKFTQHLCNTNR